MSPASATLAVVNGASEGRALTLFLILPILGSLFVLKGFDEIWEMAHKYLGLPELHTFNPWSFAGLALFLLPMLHWRAFRGAVVRGLSLFWRGVRAVFHDLPLAFLAGTLGFAVTGFVMQTLAPAPVLVPAVVVLAALADDLGFSSLQREGVSMMRSTTSSNASVTPTAVFADASTNRHPMRAANAAPSVVGTCREYS